MHFGYHLLSSDGCWPGLGEVGARGSSFVRRRSHSQCWTLDGTDFNYNGRGRDQRAREEGRSLTPIVRSPLDSMSSVGVAFLL